MPRGGQFETGLTLFLADQAPELAQAHDELYPEWVSEQIPLSLTLLYPFAPRDSLDESHLRRLRDFFGAGKPLAFLPTPGDPTNCDFGGGSDGSTLYVTCGNSHDAGTKYGLYRVKLNATGYHVVQLK